jgi:hypothetical protein
MHNLLLAHGYCFVFYSAYGGNRIIGQEGAGQEDPQ